MDGNEHRLAEIEAKSPVLKGLAEIAAYLRYDPKTVRTLIREGDFPLRLVGGVYCATKEQCRRFVEGRE